MCRDDIINALMDVHTFPDRYTNTVGGYYQAIVDIYHVHENKLQKKSSKQKVYYILNKWNSGIAVLGFIRGIYKYPVYNPRGRYDFRTGRQGHTDEYYRLE